MADHLPVEAVTHVMSFLSLSDRKEAALVCKKWYDASLDPILLKHTTVTYHPSHDKTQQGLILKRKGINLVLDNTVGLLQANSTFVGKLKDICKNLQGLSFKGSDVTENVFYTVLSQATNLMSLDLSCCNALFMSGQLLSKKDHLMQLGISLKNVKVLSLASIRYLSNATFNRLVGLFPELESLSLAGCQVIFHTSSYFGNKLSEENSTILTFQNLCTYLGRQAERMKVLNLSRTAITDATLENLASIRNLELRELHLVACKEITDDGIKLLSKLQSQLTSLNISDCVDITGACFSAVASNLPDLKQFNFGKCRQITDVPVSGLSQLQKLEHLNLSSCLHVTSEGLIKGLHSQTSSTLMHLNISGCTQVKDDFIIELCKVAPNLLELDMSSCPKISDLSLYAISAHLQGLRVLKVAWCRELTDYGLLGIKRPIEEIRRPPILEHEDEQCKCIRKCPRSHIFNKPSEFMKRKDLDEALLEQLDMDQLTSLAKLSGLRVLDLTSCHQVTDWSLTNIMQFKEMQQLSLSLCPKISDVSILQVANNMPSVEELLLNQCRRLTDTSIMAAAEKLKRLSLLEIQGCDLVTNKSMHALAVYAKRLHHLDVSMCGSITPEAVEAVENQLLYLHSVSKRVIGNGPPAPPSRTPASLKLGTGGMPAARSNRQGSAKLFGLPLNI